MNSGSTTKIYRGSTGRCFWRVPNKPSFLFHTSRSFPFSNEGMFNAFCKRHCLPEKFIQDSDTTSRAFGPFTLLGLLANYNKFEFQNPYRLRLDDFVNEGIIRKIIKSVGHTCTNIRGEYVKVQDDLPDGWTITNTLSMIGLGAIAPGGKPVPQAIDPEVAKNMIMKLYVLSGEYLPLELTGNVDPAMKRPCFLQHTTLLMRTNCSALISSPYLTRVLNPPSVAFYPSRRTSFSTHIPL